MLTVVGMQSRSKRQKAVKILSTSHDQVPAARCRPRGSYLKGGTWWFQAENAICWPDAALWWYQDGEKPPAGEATARSPANPGDD
eukprot:574007-Rhodomonas_salina.1